MTAVNTHYLLKRRHWCPISEKYTGVDSLLDALMRGWVLSHRVLYQEVWHSTRPSIVYYFRLRRGQEVLTMPVINSPLIHTVIQKYDLQVVTGKEFAVAHA